MRYFDPQPVGLPARMPSPFATEPHALARRAGEELARELQAGLADQLGLWAPGGGKMFGVLVVADRAGKIGYLRAFSGMVAGRWHEADFAAPAFDERARDAFWPDGERELAAIDEQIAALGAEPKRQALAELDARHERERDDMRARHKQRKEARHAMRASIASGARSALDREGSASPSTAPVDAPGVPSSSLLELDRESRGDTAERRRLDAAHEAERAALAAAVAADDAAERALAERRAARSRELLHAIHATYVLANARGEVRPLRELFAPAEPPGGAGDCAAPKLLAAAYRAELRPLALAELWWGAPPATGGRTSGHYYPACRGKCGPVLAHMLAGSDAEPAPEFATRRVPADAPVVLFEDNWLAIVDKPEGLLSVPGRSGALRDSALTRLRARYPGASVVHRLDLDTSGLLICAKDADTHARLQAMFARREIAKRYDAWLDGVVSGDGGVVDLPLRVDLDDRPRQIVDPVHGKAALTEWSVVARESGRTRVSLVPRTGRAHQLRVHAAHPRGIGVPIVGDRLYGRAAERLLLHAAHLAFVHPVTGERLSIDLPAPF